jgi:hypothetical protein
MESHYSTHIEGTTLTLQQSKDGDFGPKRPGIPEQKDQTFRCMKTKFSGPKRPTYPHFQALAV